MKIARLEIVMDKKLKLPRGFGYVNYEDRADGEASFVACDQCDAILAP